MRPFAVGLGFAPGAEAEGFAAERRAAVLARLRLVGACAAATIAVALLAGPPVWADSMARRGVGMTLQLGACALVYALAGGSWADRWSREWAGSVAMGFLTFFTLCLPLVTPYVPGSFEGVIGQLVLVMLLAALFLPWGTGPQGLLALVLVGELLLLFPLEEVPGARRNQGLLLFFVAGVLSLLGAHLVDRNRRVAFAERDQARSLARDRALLLDLGQELGGTKDLSALLDRVVRLARALLACDSVDLQLYDPDRGLLRVAAIDVDEPNRAESALGLEFAPFPDLLALLEEGRVIEMPGDARVRSLDPVLQSGGVRRLLVAPISWEGRLLGELDFVRVRDDRPFRAAERELVHGIANQAAIALANARLVDDLRRANRVKSEFVSTMSHELRTPLHVILGYTEMLGDPEVPNEEIVQKIRFAARELLDLIDATLDLNRLESGRDEPEFCALQVGDLLGELRDEYVALPRDARVELVWTVRDGGVRLQTDRRKLKIILKNLISNALKFTARGRVEIQAARRGAHYEISVEDTGEGIAPADLDSIFEMFRQASHGSEDRRGGFGLGLYIVRRLAGQIGAEVAVQSELGRGSCFRVSLRCAEAEVMARGAGAGRA